jgi:hypothetical protein
MPDVDISETDAPPVGEELHLPGPSIVPVLNAFGLAIALVGLTTIRVLIPIGLVIFALTAVRWIRDSVRAVAELPAEHGSH